MRFQLRDLVQIALSMEHGTVIGRAEYTYSEPVYLVRYKNKDGSAVEHWWPEDALTVAFPEKTYPQP